MSQTESQPSFSDQIRQRIPQQLKDMQVPDQLKGLPEKVKNLNIPDRVKNLRATLPERVKNMNLTEQVKNINFNDVKQSLSDQFKGMTWRDMVPTLQPSSMLWAQTYLWAGFALGALFAPAWTARFLNILEWKQSANPAVLLLTRWVGFACLAVPLGLMLVLKTGDASLQRRALLYFSLPMQLLDFAMTLFHVRTVASDHLQARSSFWGAWFAMTLDIMLIIGFVAALNRDQLASFINSNVAPKSLDLDEAAAEGERGGNDEEEGLDAEMVD